MNNPFINLPLNTERIYIKGSIKNGCDIFIPFHDHRDEKQEEKRIELQYFLDENFNKGGFDDIA